MGKEDLYSVRHQVGDEVTQISRRIVAPLRFSRTIEADDSMNLPCVISMDCSWAVSAKRYQIDRIEFKPFSDDEPITSHLLRKVQVGALLESASRSHLVLHARVVTASGTTSPGRAMDTFDEEVTRLKALGPSSHETLEWVALIYEIAAVEGSKPTQVVSEYFEISVRTASNWVRAAREQGVLDNG